MAALAISKALLLAALLNDIWVSTGWNFPLRLPPQIVRIDADYNQQVLADNPNEYAKDTIAAKSGRVVGLGGVDNGRRSLDIWLHGSRTVSVPIDIGPVVREAQYFNAQQVVGYANLNRRRASEIFVLDSLNGNLVRLEVATVAAMFLANGYAYFIGADGTITYLNQALEKVTMMVPALADTVDCAFDGRFLWVLRNNNIEQWDVLSPNWQLVSTNAGFNRPQYVASDSQGHLIVGTQYIAWCYTNNVLVGNIVWNTRDNIINVNTKPLIDGDRIIMPRMILSWLAGSPAIYSSQLEFYPWPNGGTVGPYRTMLFDKNIYQLKLD